MTANIIVSQNTHTIYKICFFIFFLWACPFVVPPQVRLSVIIFFIAKRLKKVFPLQSFTRTNRIVTHKNFFNLINPCSTTPSKSHLIILSFNINILNPRPSAFLIYQIRFIRVPLRHNPPPQPTTTLPPNPP